MVFLKKVSEIYQYPSIRVQILDLRRLKRLKIWEVA